jgi:hypothetical protein
LAALWVSVRTTPRAVGTLGTARCVLATGALAIGDGIGAGAGAATGGTGAGWLTCATGAKGLAGFMVDLQRIHAGQAKRGHQNAPCGVFSGWSVGWYGVKLAGSG